MRPLAPHRRAPAHARAANRARASSLLIVAGAIACESAAQDTSGPSGVPSGVSILALALDGSPLSDRKVRLGSYAAEPGADGVTIFTNILPGPAVARALDLEDRIIDYATAHVEVGQFHGLRLYHPEPEPWSAGFADGAGVLDPGNGVVVDFPAGTLEKDGAPFTGTLAIGGVQLDESNELAAPGDHTALHLDEIVEPVEIFNAFRIEPEDESGWRFEGTATASFPVDPALGVDDVSELYLYTFDGTSGRWAKNTVATRVGDTVSGAFTRFGWWAVGTDQPAQRSCVRGKVVDPAGDPFPGVEVLVTEDGRFGTHRAWTDGEGTWCAQVLGGVAASAVLFGLPADDFSVRYEAALDLPPATGGDCSGACADAGTTTMRLLGMSR